MREIKFRAWNNQYKRWSSTAPTIIECFRKNLPTCELIQFTGLKDKNGKEIYEGDIVRGFCTGNHPAIIVCDAPDGGYNIRELNGEFTEIDSNTMLEIIGNIYEHPELLEVK